ncbi:MAG: hypothetical protein RL220_586 [Bacteroidota bacterium]
MPTYRLDIADQFDFRLIGVSTHERDYRLAWAVNLALGWNLSRDEDLEIPARSRRPASKHSVFVYSAEENSGVYYLIENKSASGLLMPAVQQFQFLIKVDDMPDELFNEFLTGLRSANYVMTAVEISLEGLKEKENLIMQ